MKVNIKLILMACIVLSLTACAKENTFNPHLKNKQNVYAYLNATTATKPILTKNKQRLAFKNFLSHYYSPWTGKDRLSSNEDVKTYAVDVITSMTSDPGWNENKHLHTEKWVNHLIANMNMSEFPNDIHKAITIRPINERELPTNKPSYSSVTQPGWFYPFDNLQDSYLPPNLPVLILQQSKDKAWDLILNNGSSGWVPANDLALVDNKFINLWHKNKGYVEFKNDHVAIIDDAHVFRYMSHMGALFPIVSETPNSYGIRIAVSDLQGRALIKEATIKKEDVYKIPLVSTPQNIATIANQFIGMPYGWGGLYGYRDCSATTKDVFSYFGIWLPRNSTQQAKLGGKSINLKGLSNKQKLAIISQQGVPYFTLVHLPGHIMIYLGKKNNELYVFHDMWGLKTYRLFKSSGRAVVGSTVITPIDFGKHYLNVEKSLLGNAIGITILSARQRKEI